MADPLAVTVLIRGVVGSFFLVNFAVQSMPSGASTSIEMSWPYAVKNCFDPV